MSEQQPEVKIKYIKKKGGHAGGHGGGAWKIAYSDLVTAMMAFFLLMWLLSSANSNTKTGLAKYFSEGPDFFNTREGMAILSAHNQGILPGGRGLKPGPDVGSGEGLANEEAAAEKERQAMENTALAIDHTFTSDKLLQAFKDQISMDFTDEGLRIQVQDKAAQVLFDSGSANLKPYTLSILKEIAAELGKLPNQVVIGGHTDSIQYPSQAYTNWELSSERANAARRVLLASGLRPGQVQRVTGYADSVPLEGKPAGDPQNRRISIIVLSEASVKQEAASRKSKGGVPTAAAPSPKKSN
jgi:chemotaxis protein MotB